MAVNAGHLTEEQARLFAYFTSVKGMSQQLSVLFKGASRDGMTSSSRGNLTVTGKQGNGKTTLAIDIVKALQKQQQIGGNKLAKISGQKLNTKDVYEVLTRLKGGALIIEGAGGLSDATMMALSLAMETDTGGLLVILEDSAEEIERLFHKNKILLPSLSIPLTFRCLPTMSWWLLERPTHWSRSIPLMNSGSWRCMTGSAAGRPMTTW